jgi:hypothetical protein
MRRPFGEVLKASNCTASVAVVFLQVTPRHRQRLHGAVVRRGGRYPRNSTNTGWTCIEPTASVGSPSHSRRRLYDQFGLSLLAESRADCTRRGKALADPGEIVVRPPTLGEHTELVLGELGYDAATIAALREGEAI